MAAGKDRNKDSSMAAHLVENGIWHGKRTTKSKAANPLAPGFTREVGSAAYRRMKGRQ